MAPGLLQEIRAKKEELLAKQLEEEKQREDVAQKRALTKDAQKAEENSVDPIDMIGGQVLDRCFSSSSCLANSSSFFARIS
jgi:hypothetical protein